MGLDFTAFPQPTDVPGVWSRLVALVLSLTKQTTVIKGFALTAGANAVNHGGRGQRPVFAVAQVMATGVSAAAVTIDPAFTPTNLVLYASIDCTVDLEVRF